MKNENPLVAIKSPSLLAIEPPKEVTRVTKSGQSLEVYWGGHFGAPIKIAS
jgi:hypothetical protein